jgi:surface antigen
MSPDAFDARRALAILLLLVAAACGGQASVDSSSAPPQISALPPPAPPPSPNSRMQCVPYARAFTGIFIRGDAWTWWHAAGGIYSRGNVPEPYSLLVLAKTERLRSGHLAVVTGIEGPREIRVSHANWLNDERIFEHVRVLDVSEANDWSELRFWNPQTGNFGQVYQAYGFVYRNPGSSGA